MWSIILLSKLNARLSSPPLLYGYGSAAKIWAPLSDVIITIYNTWSTDFACSWLADGDCSPRSWSYQASPAVLTTAHFVSACVSEWPPWIRRQEQQKRRCSFTNSSLIILPPHIANYCILCLKRCNSCPDLCIWVHTSTPRCNICNNLFTEGRIRSLLKDFH